MISHADFRKTILKYYRESGRDLPWRRTRNPYLITISEIMLQQTQVARVEGYYRIFTKKFPNLSALAKAKRSEVLEVWQGLGYNRRALALHKLAQIVINEYDGTLPRERATLEGLPGIGPYTAGAIRTFSFGEPDVFIETNIRRVFIHFFFPRTTKVTDERIMPLIERTLDSKDPRVWYFALMDYGAMLGVIAKEKNPNRRSAHYVRQSKFAGSDRELRGKILRLVLAKKKMKVTDLQKFIPRSDARILKAATALIKEGLLKKKKDILSV